MRREWVFQIVALVIIYLDSIIYVEHEGISFSEEPVVDLIFELYEALLYLTVNYVLIPRLFYKKNYVVFFGTLIGVIMIFGVIEESFVEKILTPNSRGNNDLTWQSIYWFFGEILVPLLTFMTIKFVFDNFAQQQKLERIEQDRLANELQLLKSQIQPHILFNSLNNLYHFALEKSEYVPGLIIKLSNVLRYVLYETKEERVPVGKELVFVRDYIDLQEIQYKGRGVIRSDIQNEYENESLMIAPFLLIPFIENSFKHSFGTKIKDVFIDMKISIEGGEIHLYVRNNFEQKSGEGEELIQGGIGLVNVRKRLQLLYPNQHSISVFEGDKEYTVDVKIKLA